MSDFFRFEDKEWDFPFYKNNPHVSKLGWFLLLFSVVFAFLAYGVVGLYSEFIGSLFFCFMMLIPLLYVLNWKYDLVFRKPRLKDVGLAVLMFAGYIAYAFLMSSLLGYIQVGGTTSTNPPILSTVETYVSFIFSLMGEELLKFIPLMFFLRLIYRFSNNRKLSICLSALIVMLGFGALHYDAGLGIVYAILIQGFGTIFEIFGYIKTKNIFVPYMSHIMTDVFLLLMTTVGF